MSWWSFKPYVSVAQRRANAMKEVKKLAGKGRPISPVQLEGKKIANTFWGKAWCDNLETYSDYASRLPRGRSYVRNGSVVDLQIKAGLVTALVSGSELYRVKIDIKPLSDSTWAGIRQSCAGKIASVIELLKGRISDHVMGIVTNQATGLFPSPREIEMDCSCPDWAGMCKHVAATLYGIGARLDHQPDLLFVLRKVDHLDLVARAAEIQNLSASGSDVKTIDAQNLADVFGIEFDEAPSKQNQAAPPAPVVRVTVTKSKRRSKAAFLQRESASAKYSEPSRKTTDEDKPRVKRKTQKRRQAKSSVTPL